MHREVWLPSQVRCKLRLCDFRGWWHDAHQRSGPQHLRLLKHHAREHWTIRCSHSVWILCFARFSWWFCSSYRKQIKHAIGKPLLDREKEKVLWSVLQNRCQRKINGTVFVWVWRVLFWRNSQKILFWWMRSPRTSWTKSSTSYCWWKFSSEKITLDWVQHGDPKFGTKKFRIRIVWVTARAWVSKTTVVGRYSLDRSSSTWENTNV